MSHTKGPWEIDGEITVEGMGAFCIMSPSDVREEGPIIVAAVLDISTEAYPNAGYADANAKLIAAAPDLLEACKQSVELFEAWRDGIFARLGIHWIEEPPAIKEMRAAIAKATGKAVPNG